MVGEQGSAAWSLKWEPEVKKEIHHLYEINQKELLMQPWK